MWVRSTATFSSMKQAPYTLSDGLLYTLVHGMFFVVLEPSNGYALDQIISFVSVLASRPGGNNF